MAISYLTGTTAGGTDPGVTTSAIDSSGANLLVCHVAAITLTGTLSDNKGNTWTALTSRTASGGIYNSRLFYCLNPISVGSGHTFSFSGSGTFPQLSVLAYSGVGSYSQESGSAVTSSTSIQPGSITPATDGCLLVAGVGRAGTATISINGGFTGFTGVGVPGLNVPGGIWGLVQSTAAAANPTMSWSDSASAAATMACFSAAATGPNPAVLHHYYRQLRNN